MLALDRAASITGYRVSSTTDDAFIVHGIEASVVGQDEHEPLTPLVSPRLSLDARVADAVSVGVSVSYGAHRAEQSTGDHSQPLPSSESLLLGPRLGWFRPLSRQAAVWLRGGPTWARQASSTPIAGGELRVVDQNWALSFEPQLLVMPLPHLGFSFGGAFDLGVGGDHTVRSPDAAKDRTPITAWTYGVTAGLLALF